MNKKEYLATRQKLMDEAQKALDEGKAKEAEEKMNEVKELDGKWDAIAQAQANYDALNKDPKPMFNEFGEENGINIDGMKKENENDAEKAWASKEYESAWAKNMMNKPLTNEESRTFAMVNEAYTHTTQNTGVVIPKNVAKGIWEMAGEMYPYFQDIAKTYVNGTLSIIQEDTSSESGWYTEEQETEDGKETLKEFTLGGCELSRAITVSWKLREMAIEDFIPYIQRKMAKKMGAGAGYGATHGAGPLASNGKPEPNGVVTALEAESGKPQIVEYANGKAPTWQDITKTRGKVKSGYGAGLKIYANSSTIWNKLANILDANGRPIFMQDSATGVYRILGAEVKEDDSMKDGEILFSNPSEGYHMNINKEMSVTPEEHVKARKTDYCGYAIMDGNVITTKAHALLKEAAGK